MRGLILIASVVVALLFPANRAVAATIEKASSPRCVIMIQGDIVEGDFDKFVSLGKLLLPGDNGESTAGNTVCLDSPGGSLSEGVKFARYFYDEGIGTVVDEGQGCYSACAIMFMMGIATGDEVSFVNRKLHVGGKLGFHRPYLRIPPGESVDVSEMEVAYDAALSGALDLIAVANSKSPWSSDPMMKPDLMQKMLQHIGEDMLMIDTVDKAGRWDIELIGMAEPSLLSEEQAFYACENSLQWQNGLTEGDITYATAGERSTGGRRSKSIAGNTNQTAYEVEGLAAGYADERCIISLKGGELFACGVDEYSDAKLGQGQCDGSSFESRGSAIDKIAVFNPSTPIAALQPGKTAAPLQSKAARCVVLKGAQIVDDEPCQIIVMGEAEVRGRPASVTHYLWPSGSKTILVRYSDGLEINGVPTAKRTVVDRGDCYVNNVTSNEFCVQAQSN